MVYPALLPLLQLMRTPRLPVVDRTDAPANLNGFVRFAESRNMVSVSVELHFKRSLHLTLELFSVDENWEGVVKGLHKRKSKQ